MFEVVNVRDNMLQIDYIQASCVNSKGVIKGIFLATVLPFLLLWMRTLLWSVSEPMAGKRFYACWQITRTHLSIL